VSQGEVWSMQTFLIYSCKYNICFQ
jgi:hypothetical protein